MVILLSVGLVGLEPMSVRSIFAARAWNALASRFAPTNSSRFRLRRTIPRSQSARLHTVEIACFERPHR